MSMSGVNIPLDEEPVAVDVGQLIQLSLTLDSGTEIPVGPAPGDYKSQWSLPGSNPVSAQGPASSSSPGDYIKGYDHTKTSYQQVANFTDADYTKGSFAFYWVNGGTRSVKAVVTDPWRSTTVIGTFDITRPTGIATATPNTEKADPWAGSIATGYKGLNSYVFAPQGQFLSGTLTTRYAGSVVNKKPGVPGMVFDGGAWEDGFTFSWAQVITTAFDQVPPAVPNVSNALDNTFPYSGDEQTTHDSPYISYNGVRGKVGTSYIFAENFVMWFGCEPDVPNTIWIPLAKLAWGFHMTVVVPRRLGICYCRARRLNMAISRRRGQFYRNDCLSRLEHGCDWDWVTRDQQSKRREFERGMNNPMRSPIVHRSVATAMVGAALLSLAPAVCAGHDVTASPSSGDRAARDAINDRFEVLAALKADDAACGTLTDRLGRRFHGVRTDAFVFPAAPQPGEPVTVVISTKNVGSVPVYAHLAEFDSDPCEIFIHDIAGRLAPLTPLGRKKWVEPYKRSGNDSPKEVRIDPGFAVAEKVRVEMYYDLSRPGRYTILAGRPITFEVGRRPMPKQANGKTENLDITSGLIDEQTSFQRRWQTASAVAGRVYKDLQLTCFIASEERRGTNLVVSLTNICRSGAVAHNDGRSYSDSYSPEDGIEVPVGTRAADYQLLLRDASDNPVAMSAEGQAWLRESKLDWDRLLRPGEALGFAFPLDELFALTPGQRYTVIVVLRGKRHDDPPWVAGPITVRVPALEIPGVTRPRYGSTEFWTRLASSASARSANLTLESSIGDNNHYAVLGMELVNRSGRPVPAHLKKGDDTVLIRDSRGDAVLPNESAKDDSPDWGFVRGEQSGILHPRGTSPGTTPAPAAAMPLVPYIPFAGTDYNLLAAVSLREANALVVGGPVAFRLRNPYSPWTATPHVEAITPKPLPNVPQAFGQRWQEYERFAGKEFEGLLLQSHATSSLQLDVSLQNCSHEPILVKKWKGDSDYQILVRDPSGKPAAMTEKGKKFFGDRLRS